MNELRDLKIGGANGLARRFSNPIVCRSAVDIMQLHVWFLARIASRRTGGKEANIGLSGLQTAS